MEIKCTRCRWYDNEEGVNCTGIFGNQNADIIFVGEAFGSTEAKAGIAFVGKAGEIFDKLLKLIDLTREDVAVINAIRCYQVGNPTPTTREMDSCFIHTYRDIQKIKPKVVVAMGESAFYQVSGKTKDDYKFYRDRLFYSEKIKCNVFTVFHPAAVLYDNSRLDKLEVSFKKLPLILGFDTKDVYNYDYIYIDTQDGFNKVSQRFDNCEEIFFDVESTGLDFYNDELTLVQMSDGQEPVCLFDPPLINTNRDKVNEWFKTKKITGQGWEFDAKFIKEKFDIFPEIWDYDTCLAEYIISGMGSNDLTSLVWRYCPESGGYDDYVRLVGGAQNVKDKTKLHKYASTDVGVLPKIKEKQIKILKAMDKYDLFMDLVMPTNKVLTKMSIRGVQYDLETLWRLDEEYVIKAEKAMYKAIVLPGIKETEIYFNQRFNPKSSFHIRHLLLEYHNLPILKETKKGNPSITITEMEKYAKNHNNEYCKTMLKYRSYNTVRKNFLGGVVDKLVDGVAHTSYGLHSTETGRPNSKNPNLLNLPRKEGQIKECLVAREGYKFVYADEGQLEVRIAAVIYDEPKLIDICNNPTEDMHSRITAQILGYDYDYINKGHKVDPKISELRTHGKEIQFGILYQRGAASLAYELGISKEKAQGYIDSYYTEFPSLYKNIKATKAKVIKQWYLDNYFNFRRRWKKPTGEKAAQIEEAIQREAVNFLIQSVAWNLIELAMIQIDQILVDKNLYSYLLLQVYDAIAVESPDNEVEQVGDIVRTVMEGVNKPYPNLNRVRLTTDVQAGDNLKNLVDLQKSS